MQIKQYRYPGDPPADLAIMSRSEFLRLYPRPTLYDEEEAYRRGADFVVMPEANEIICDGCDRDVTGEVYVYRYEKPGQCRPSDRAYCKACAEKSFLPYCK
jgi:hypothetical protein